MWNSQPFKILAVDDEMDIITSIQVFLGKAYSVTGFTSGEKALEAARQETFPVAIVDLCMPDLTGIEVLEKLKEICPQQQVLILTGHSCKATAIDALNLGAFRYLLKPLRVEQFRADVAAAFARYGFEITALPTTPLASEEELKALGLSRRESEVALEMLEDKTSPGIAKTLGISSRTVDNHVQAVLKFFSIPSRTKLAEKLRALRMQWYSRPPDQDVE